MNTTDRHCVLVVDDEPAVVDSVHDLLRREFRVLRAGSAAEGHRLMQQEEVHIILTDQRMPRVSGVELLESAKSHAPQAVRLLFTGFADLDSVIAAINQGHVFQFLKKPWDPNELLEAVRVAAAEYDRLRAQLDDARKMREELAQLKARVDQLEAQLSRPPATAGRARPAGR